MTLIVKNGKVQSNTVVNARIPKGLYFTYMPNFTSTSSYNIGMQNFENTYDEVDTNQTNKPLGKVIGKRYTSTYGPGGIYSQYDDLASPSFTPTLQIYNDTENLYNYSDDSPEYIVGFWVKINSFPTRVLETGMHGAIRKKRVNLIRMIYGSDGSGFDSSNIGGMLEFGAMAPHYIHNDSPDYYFQYSPFSFSCTVTFPSNNATTINGNYAPRCYSWYTNFEFSLGTWYFVQLRFRSGADNLIQYPLEVTAMMYVNNVQKNLMSHKSKVVSNRGSGSQTQANIRASSRYMDQVATGPGYKTKSGSDITYALESPYQFNAFPDLRNLNHISFSPVWTTPGLGNRNSTQMTGVGSGIDFGQFYIYNTYDINPFTGYSNIIYNTHKRLYS